MSSTGHAARMSGAAGAESKPTAGQEKRRREVLFPLYSANLSENAILGLSSAQVGRLARDVHEATRALNWLHGEGFREAALAPQSDSDLRKRASLHQLSQRRLEICACRHLDGSRAIELSKASVNLLKGRKVYDSSGSTSVASYVYDRVSLPADVQSAPLLASQLPDAESKILMEFVPAQLRTPKAVADHVEL